MTTPTPPAKKRTKKQKPIVKFIRLVMQLEDTPMNRQAIEAVRQVAASQGVQGTRSAITVSEVNILEFMITNQLHQAQQ